MLTKMQLRNLAHIRPDVTALTLHDIGLVLVGTAVFGSLGYGVFAYGPRFNTISDAPSAAVEMATIKLVEAPRPAERPGAASAAPAASPVLMQDVLPEDSFEIARKVQTALKNAGCYRGRVNGAWTPATRKAMQTFATRTNATIPVDKPDVVLLALVTANPETRCDDAPAQSQKGEKVARSETNETPAEKRDAQTRTSSTITRAPDNETAPRPALIPPAPALASRQAGEAHSSDAPDAATPAQAAKPPAPKKVHRKNNAKSTFPGGNIAKSFFKDVQKVFNGAF